jgi:HEAT repeat protein
LLREAGRTLPGAVLAVVLSGCATFVDDITAVSPEGGFWNNMQYRKELLLSRRRDPLEILATSRDGDLRARAYRALREPKACGGSEEEQAKVLHLLAEAARSEKDLVCRLAAVEKLGQFQDPRAFQALQEAFYAPANFQAKDPVVRIAAVQGMGRVGNPEAVATLGEILTRDPSREVRLAAADALGRFPTGPAAQALVKVLKDEKDVALRHRAGQSLRQMTGKDLPPQAQPWEEYLRDKIGPDQKLVREPSRNPLQQVMFWDK